MDDNTIRVLLIEDNLGDVRLIREMLAEARDALFDLECVDRLSTGLGRLDEGDVDVVLLDLGLPDSQGLDTLAKVQAQVPQVPILVLTGLEDERVGMKAVREGAQDYLVKGQMDKNPLVRAMRYAIERKRAEEALRQRNRDLALLNRLGQELTATFDLPQLTGRLLETVMETIGAEAVSVWLLDEERKSWLVCQAAFPPDQNRSLVNLHLPPGQGVAGWVAQEGESVVVANVQDDPRFFSGIDEQTGFHTTSLLAVPLRARSKVIGVLEVVNKQDGDFDGDDRALVEMLAASAAIAIENARLYVQAQQEIAERKRAEEEREKLIEELDAFAHTVAHDLKSPLCTIANFAEMLEEDYANIPDEEIRDYLQTIVRGGHKASNIVDELLLLAGVRKVEEVEMRPLDMASIVAEAQQRLALMIEEHQAEIILPDTWPVALGYGPWVEEVWVNYLSNAIKYGGQPPRLELGAGPPSVPPASGEEAKGRRRVRFWVRDNGPGMKLEEQAHLFTPFTRLDQVHTKGHGLGLSIVWRIVEKLGGQAGVESEVGQGSVFSFTLPARAGDQ
jgi:signal transduction histidine kinase/DNA-binding NarL/FixJ family response regulator